MGTYLSGPTSIGPRDTSMVRTVLGDRATNTLGNIWRSGTGFGKWVDENFIQDDAGAPAAPTPLIMRPTPSAPPSRIQAAADRMAPPKTLGTTPSAPADDTAPAPVRGQPFMGPASDIRAAASRLADSYKTPEWRGVGGGPRSAAQMDQDFRAHEQIDRGYRQAVDENNLDASILGDPAQRAIDARKKDLAYEDLLPASALSSIKFGSGKNDAGLMDYADQRAPEVGMPTLGEARSQRSLIAQQAARQNPKDVSTANLETGRGRLAEELSLLRGQLDQQVSRAAGTPNEAKVRAAAESHWQNAVATAKTLAEIIKTGYPTQPDLGAGLPATER